jgi:DICT domain-containing protein
VTQITASARLTKSTLVTISHAIERAALAAAEDGPMAVIALFQRLPYFERERAIYEQIAKSAAVSVVGLVGAQAPDLPAGPYVVLLDDQEELAREWAVVVVTPRFGAVLSARDREEVDGDYPTLEGGRVFDGFWRFRRDDALHELLRLRAALAHRVPPAARSVIDAVVDRIRDLPSAPGESRAEASMRMLVDRANRDQARIRAWRRAAAGPPSTGEDAGLTSTADMRRWSGADGVTASGTLPVAVFGVHVAPGPEPSDRFARRSATLRTEGLVGVLTGLLRPSDRATRVGPDEYLLILPGLAYADALDLAYRVGTGFAAAAERNPFLSATPTVVMLVTRTRPLPVERVREALRWAVSEGVPVATVNEE